MKTKSSCLVLSPFRNNLVRSSLVAAALMGINTATQAALVGYWGFEEGTGTTTTEQVSSTESDAFVDTTWSTDVGVSGSTASLDFAGTGTGANSDHAGVGTGLTSSEIGFNGSGTKTISAWIKTTTTVQGAYFGYSPGGGNSAGADLRLMVNGSGGDTTGKLRMEISSGGFDFDPSSNLNLNDGEWHMVAVIINANDGINDVDVYIDGTYTTRSGGGTLVNTGNSPGPYFQDLVFGSHVNAGKSYDGLLDEVRIYDTALNETELDALYTTIPEPSSLVLLGCFVGAFVLLGRRSRRVAG